MRCTRRGFLFIEAVGALLLVAALATVLAVAVGRHNRTQAKLADSRSAARLAERVLAEMQTGGKIPEGDAETTITLRRVEGEAKVGEYGWMEASVSVRGQRASVWGLALPAAAEKGRRP